jgi:SOS response regulatory protein OraA/RecX
MAMRIESVRERASGTLEVAVSGGLLFNFDAKDAQLLGYSFDCGDRVLVAVDGSTMSLMPNEFCDEGAATALGRLNNLHRARKDALSIVSCAEQASKQLYEKLLKKGYATDIARTCILWMCAERYVDDRRYVKLLLQSHVVRRGQGPDRVKAIAWSRIGLLENSKSILADGFAALEEDGMQDAIRRSCAKILRRTQNLPSDGRRLGRGFIRSLRRPGNFSWAPGDDPDAEPRGMSFAERRSLLRAYLKDEGFPPKAVEKYLESWEVEQNDKN